MRVLLQSLQSRFHLAFHWQTRPCQSAPKEKTKLLQTPFYDPASQRPQKRNECAFLVRAEVKTLDSGIKRGILTTTLGVEIHHPFKRFEGAIMHIWRRASDLAQSWHLEFALPRSVVG